MFWEECLSLGMFLASDDIGIVPPLAILPEAQDMTR